MIKKTLKTHTASNDKKHRACYNSCGVNLHTGAAGENVNPCSPKDPLFRKIVEALHGRHNIRWSVSGSASHLSRCRMYIWFGSENNLPPTHMHIDKKSEQTYEVHFTWRSGSYTHGKDSDLLSSQNFHRFINYDYHEFGEYLTILFDHYLEYIAGTLPNRRSVWCLPWEPDDSLVKYDRSNNSRRRKPITASSLSTKPDASSPSTKPDASSSSTKPAASSSSTKPAGTPISMSNSTASASLAPTLSTAQLTMRNSTTSSKKAAAARSSSGAIEELELALYEANRDGEPKEELQERQDIIDDLRAEASLASPSPSNPHISVSDRMKHKKLMDGLDWEQKEVEENKAREKTRAYIKGQMERKDFREAREGDMGLTRQLSHYLGEGARQRFGAEAELELESVPSYQGLTTDDYEKIEDGLEYIPEPSQTAERLSQIHFQEGLGRKKNQKSKKKSKKIKKNSKKIKKKYNKL